jgi:hypothetical protein
LRQRSCLAENTAQPSSDVLPVEQALRMMPHDFLHSVQGAIDHHHFLTIFRTSLACLYLNRRIDKIVAEQVFRFRIFGLPGLFKVVFDYFLNLIYLLFSGRLL